MRHENRDPSESPGVVDPRRAFLADLPVHAVRVLTASQELSLARDVPSIGAIAGSAARELAGADGVSFVLRDGDQCHYVDEEAIAPLWKGRRFPLATCLSGLAMTERTPVVVPDISGDSRVPQDLYRATFVRSLAMVPVLAPEPVAAIGAYWARPHQATPMQLGALAMLADSAALALVNARLFHELRRSADAERAARGQAEAAVAQRDQFLALVAHELRQPLQASLSALRVMEARVSVEAGARAREIVERQLRQMNRQVEDLVDAARIVRGYVDLNRVRLDLQEVLVPVADSLGLQMRERGLTFNAIWAPAPVAVYADPGRLQQVFTNLLANAAKYTDPPGVVTMAVSTRLAPPLARVSIRDTGRGIAPATLPRIFDLFTRGSSSQPGFGIGLAVARQLVELHDGTIDAQSAGPGRGSEFVVRLPLVE